MIYIKRFNKNTDYNAYIVGKKSKFPNVSLVEDISSVKYTRKRPIIIMGVKFTANAEQGLTVSFNGVNPNFEYSYDCEKWVVLNPSTTVSFGTTEHPYVYVRGDNANGVSNGVSNYANFVFTNSSTPVDASGNIMDLIDWTKHPTTIPNAYCFYKLFNGCKALQTVSSSLLPATELTPYCYANMFDDCVFLSTLPSLPADTLAENCYDHMFYMCASGLTSMPQNYLHATHLAKGCYQSMFQQCEVLSSVSDLPAMTLAENCYNNIFCLCKKVTSAPSLPATALTAFCYKGMFYGTGIETTPALPATVLAKSCYYMMFQGCQNLTTVPSLPAETLAPLCYSQMFYGCSALKEIHCSATNISAANCTNIWLSSVSPTGDFYGKSAAGWTTGQNGIPNGWTRHLD